VELEDVQIREGDTVAVAEYGALLGAVGWQPPEEPEAVVQRALGATWNVTARTADGTLVGLARVLDDGLLYASIWDVIVAPEYQRRGIGHALVARVLERTAGRRLVSLIATAAGEALYRAEGFHERDARSTALFRRQPALSPPDRQGKTGTR
jgi:ribosomal protein S18 acetylase RimI-like enzyme